MKKPVNKVLNLNLGKREKIQQANSTTLLVVIIASIVVSMALVMGNFLLKQKGYNDRVYKEKKIARDTLRQNVINSRELESKFKDIEDSNSLANSKTILDALPSNYDNMSSQGHNCITQPPLIFSGVTHCDLHINGCGPVSHKRPIMATFAELYHPESGRANI